MDSKYVAIEHLADEKLRAARQSQGMTQLDLADQMAELGFPWSQPTVARVERGRRPLSLAEAHALLDILELNSGNLYRRIDPLRSESD
jgi:transcriptional regulator with XRE-family HTH domain